METGERHLELTGISKTYSGMRALDGVSFHIGRGETLGLVGENGAGKSTLMNILCGIQRADSGAYRFAGVARQFRTSAEAEAAGVFRVHQEQALIGPYRVSQNMYLGHEKHFCRFGILQIGEMTRRAQEILTGLGITIPAEQITTELSFGARQLIEVARVVAKVELLGIRNPLVLLDEPTASLSGPELDIFYRIVARLKTGLQASLLFVSHRLGEVISLSDRVLVLKDGRVVRDDLRAPTEGELHRLMVGRDRIEDFYAANRQRTALGQPVLELQELSGEGFTDVSLTVAAGEIVGLGGLAQSGKHELGRAIFGLAPARGGLFLKGASLMGLEPSRRVQMGAGYVPLDRHHEGVMLNRSVTDNIVLGALRALTPGGLARPEALRAYGEAQIGKFRIKTADGSMPIRSLSGGNQQKAVLARWLAKEPTLLVVDNPTRGVDAGAKEEIYGFLRDFTDRGGAVLLITDDLVELIELSNQIALMAGGRPSSFIDAAAGRKPAEHDIIHLMF